jgi:hypothetical protein
MNKIFTLFVMGMLCLSVNRSFAQVNENFEGALPSCWTLTNATQTASNKGINQKSIAFSNTTNTTFATPYITVTNGLLDILFNYQLSSNSLQNGKTRTIRVGYQAKGGAFISLSNIINVTTKTTTAFKVNNSNTFVIPNGTYRIVIMGTADGADDNVLIDDLKVSGGTYYYGLAPCNTSPITEGDTYNVTGYGTHDVTRSVLENDKDPVNTTETLKAVFGTMDPAQGTITLNEDGTFIYKPNPTFMGSIATFTYKAVDNGYDPASSAETMVSINIVEGTILPVKLISFSGNLVSNKALLTWQVAENETGSHFEVQKSLDGKSFEAHTVVFCSAKTGAEAYQYTDAAFTTNKAYYRLKTINKDGSISYSKVIYLTNVQDAANQSLRLLQNPVQNTLSFAFTAVATEETEIAIYNMAGVKLHTQKINAAKGTNQITLDIDSKLGTGTYVLTVQSATANRVTKFVKY